MRLQLIKHPAKQDGRWILYCHGKKLTWWIHLMNRVDWFNRKIPQPNSWSSWLVKVWWVRHAL